MNLLYIWDAVEADFQRDYGINLVEQIDVLSWRRFSVLFGNLSPYGAVAEKVAELKKHPPEEVSEDEGRSQATAFWAAVMSTGGKRG